MRITERDVALLKDVALSHVMTRDQILALRYFSSVTRLNTRLRHLRTSGLLNVLPTPFLQQNLYLVDRRATGLLGERIGALVRGRTASPRFVQHALATTNVRIALNRRGAIAWRFEQQLWTSFDYIGRPFSVRPDGMAIIGNDSVLVEVDLGHVAPQKFRQKLLSYDAFLISGACKRHWNVESYSVLTITTGRQRAWTLRKLTPSNARFSMQVMLFEELGAKVEGGWS